jgi:hypothetical protein
MIKSFCQILRPQIETPHDKAAEKMVKLAVQERVKTSNVRMAASRGSTKPLQAQFREQFRALSNPIQVLPATSSLSPTGSNLTSKKSAAHGQMSDGRVHAEHTPASRRQDAKDKIALDSTMWDKPVCTVRPFKRTYVSMPCPCFCPDPSPSHSNTRMWMSFVASAISMRNGL